MTLLHTVGSLQLSDAVRLNSPESKNTKNTLCPPWFKFYPARFRLCRTRSHTVRGIVTLCLLAMALFTAPDSRAATLRTQHVLTSTAANQAALAAVATCRKNGYRVSAAVVNRDGVIQSLVRADGAGVHTVDSSRRKAYTAASMGRPTGKFAELVSKHPDLHALGDMNASILLLGGGFPVRIKGEIIGGIGVGGAPGAHLDEACARAGLKALGADIYQQ